MSYTRLAAPIFLAAALAGCPHGGGASGDDPLNPPGDQPAFPFVEHMDQARITSGLVRFDEAFLFGDELFGTAFNALDGAGALALPDGTTLTSRFSRVPPGGGRFTGPNGNACVACHNTPFETSAGEASGNVLQDPSGLGLAGGTGFNLRNSTSLFGAGALQRLAEEMTEELHALRDAAQAEALAGAVGTVAARDLSAKGIAFGRVSAHHAQAGVVTVSAALVTGVDGDLVVRPYGWKGNVTTLRDFMRGAAADELGMEPEEVVAKHPAGAADPAGTDLDGDGVAGELTAGDVTALTIYVAAQEIPAETERLVRAGHLPPSPGGTGALVTRGRALFDAIGCASCHTPEMRLADPVFAEPTARGRGAYLDPDLAALGLDVIAPLTFHLVQQGDFPRLEPHPQGGARVALFGDLRRHRMGARLADAQPTFVAAADGRRLLLDGALVTVPRDVFLTAELWGVGNTGPWLHDGRAGSLGEAILLHGDDALLGPVPPPGDPLRSEAQEARDAYAALDEGDRTAVVEFLKSLQLFALPLAGE